MNKHVLILGNLPYAQKKIGNVGCKITLFITKEELELDLSCLDYANQTVILEDITNIKKKCMELHKLDPFDGVISFKSKFLLYAAEISNDLNIKGLSVESINKSENKNLLRNALDSVPECNVKYRVCKDVEDINSFYKNYNLKKMILKPLKGSGSKGVILVNSKDEILSAFNYSSNYGLNTVLAEEYAEGIDYSVETFSYNGNHSLIALTDKYNSGPPNFVGTYHVMPSLLNKKKTQEIFYEVQKCLDAIGLKFGPAHTEIKVLNNEVKLIETQIRPGGRFYLMMEFGLGIDIFELTIKKMFDEEYAKKVGKGSSSIMYISSEKNGVLKKIEGVTESMEKNFVCDITIKKEIGCKVQKCKNTSHRLGHIICTGETPQESLENSKVISQNIKITIDNE